MDERSEKKECKNPSGGGYDEWRLDIFAQRYFPRAFGARDETGARTRGTRCEDKEEKREKKAKEKEG